jgi:hypothetical protein
MLFLTGAPDSDTLQWDTATLTETFSRPVARFAGLVSPDDQKISLSLTSPAARQVSWRSLELSRSHLPTGYSQINGWVDKSREDTTFFTPAGISFTSTGLVDNTSELPVSQASTSQSVEGVLSQFYEQSFAVHADIASSQIPPPGSDANDTFLTNDGTSFISTASNLSSISQSVNGDSNRQPIPVVGHLCNLSSIPNAQHLQSIQPQTMTVNLIVGIISVSPPRGITTRRGAAVEIVELLVGDDTKSGFGVNYWLRSNPNQADDGTRRTLESLRPQDIVLLTNVALSSFQGKVYGQSLRKDMTKVYLLFRNRVDRTDSGGCYTAADLAAENNENEVQVEKTRRVAEWVLRFVGPGAGRKLATSYKRDAKGKRKVDVATEVLPPDTQ